MFSLMLRTCILLTFGLSSSFAGNRAPELHTTLNRIMAISCDSTGLLCVAIGFAEEPHLYDRLVYRSQDGGETWTEPFFLAAPKDEVEHAFAPSATSLKCSTSGMKCILTSFAVINKLPTPIVYTTEDNGLSWSEPQILPLPKDVNSKHYYPNDVLAIALACDSNAVKCKIAGGLRSTEEQIPFLYSSIDGKKWSLYTQLKYEGSSTPRSILHGTYFSDVTCNQTGQRCLIVGNAITANSFWSSFYSTKPIIYSTEDGGEHWNKPILLPTKVEDNTGSALTHVACEADGLLCTAIATTIDFVDDLQKYSGEQNHTELSSFNTYNGGVDWSDKITITEEIKDSPLSLGFSCDNSGNRCVLVGEKSSTINTLPIIKPLVYTTIDGARNWEKGYANLYIPSTAFTSVFCNHAGDVCLIGGIRADQSQKMLSTMRVFKNQERLKLPKPQHLS